jgi:enoyl-CoA hydratase/carnithine racemase
VSNTDLCLDCFNFELRADGIAFLRIDRPPVNSMSRKAFTELLQVLRHIELNTQVRALIITGTGKAFVAGADVNDLREDTMAELSVIGNRALSAFEDLYFPTIVAINGFCFGAGLEMAMACDIRIAASNAILGQPEVQLGIIPGAGGTQRLTRLVGKPRASELILTGEPISAEIAYGWGLVNKVVPLEKLEEEAIAMAQRIMKNAPIAVNYAKRAIKMAQGMVDLQAGIEFEAQCFANCFKTEDREEGIKAFLEKRKPQFKGK